MDFPLAAPVREALLAAVERDDTGYADPPASGSPRRFAGFVERRDGLGDRPARR